MRLAKKRAGFQVKDVLRVLQGYSAYSLQWDEETQQFLLRNGVHVSDLSQSSLHRLLQIFSRAATSLRRVELFVRSVLKDTNNSWLKPISQANPTLEAFANAVFMRLECLRKAALEKELEAATDEGSTRVTLLSELIKVWDSHRRLSELYTVHDQQLFSGAEFLEHIVEIAIPEPDKLFGSKVSAVELATHILSALYKELDALCLLQDGERFVDDILVIDIPEFDSFMYLDDNSWGWNLSLSCLINKTASGAACSYLDSQ